MKTPTNEAYAELEMAHDHFNTKLFGGVLQRPMFTLQREKRTFGYCSRHRFLSRNGGQLVDEIAMNPAYFAIRTIRKTLSTLAHEMTHQHQMHHGNPGRRGYHNKEWASLMESIGLMPSSTGEPGGAKTGEQMTHYIIEGGPFDLACNELLTRDFTLSWVDKYPPERPPAPRSPTLLKVPGEPEASATGGNAEDLEEDDNVELMPGLVLPSLEPVNRCNRVKYYCDECTGQAWGKPGMHIFCGGRTWKKGDDVCAVTHSPLAMRQINLTSMTGPSADVQHEVEQQNSTAEQGV